MSSQVTSIEQSPPPTTKTSLEQNTVVAWVDRTIEVILLLAFGLTPLVFTPLTNELFEFPKMVLVYFLAVIGLLLWGIKLVQQGHINLCGHPFIRMAGLFLFVTIISTILSLDIYTSIAGYYSRFNGGLASLLAYLFLFYLTLDYLKSGYDTFNRKLNRILWAWLIASVLVSIWAILEHFGIFPSCYILRGTWVTNCWVQDSQARVFATFGQPNWLAAYLAATIPLALAMLANSVKYSHRLTLAAILMLNYAAFWYTFSRSGWIGLAIALVILLPWLLKGRVKSLLPWVSLITIACVAISLSSLNVASQRTATTLESGNLDSSTGQIRLLVWGGSLATITRYPLFGSGPETFAYSFLAQRPAELNNTTEWNFLYNKAHNDLLHMATTVGIIGTLAWLGLYIVLNRQLWQQRVFAFSRQPLTFHQTLALGLAAGIVGTFTAQLLGFSVVVTSLLFWLSAGIIIAPHTTSRRLTLIRPAAHTSWLAGSVIVPSLLLIILLCYTAAEVFASIASANSSNLWLSTRQYQLAIALNPHEPSYPSQLAFNYAFLAQTSEGDYQKSYIQSGLHYARQAEVLNPHNILTLKSLIFTYRQLALTYSPATNQAIRAAEEAYQLDHRDAVVLQDLANLYLESRQFDKARQATHELIYIRPNSAESYLTRAKYYLALNQNQLALGDLHTARNLDPNNFEVKKKITELSGE